MTRKDFYDSVRKERRIDFCADLRVVRQFFLRKYGITQADFEFLLKLDSLDKFIKQDFEEGEIVCHWDKHRWKRLRKNDEWIVVWRRRDGSAKNYNIYKTSKKCSEMVTRFYKMLCGEEFIPEDPRSNPIMKKETYSDKTYSTAMINFNKALRAKREEQNN